MQTYPLPSFSQNNLWSLVRQYATRGGFENGLNPALVGKIWYVNANSETDQSERKGPVGSDSNSGLSPLSPFATVERAFEFVGCYDVIVLDGVIREQVVAPANIYDVTLIGAANTPRQATSGGVPTGGGATWMPPTSPTAGQALLELQTQGWNVFNISFTPHTSSAGIRTTRSASVDATDGSHFRISNCMFNAQGGSGQIGVEDNGGASFGMIDNCRFIGLTGTAIKGLNTASNVPQGWRITANRFNSNTNAIAMSLNQGLVDNNFIRQTADDANNKVNLIAVSGQGEFNQVINNVFSDAAANVTIAKGYKPGANDVWRNFVTDVAAYIVTVPA